MGMGTSACHADTVTNEFVTKTCPEEYKVLLEVLQENDYDIDRLAYCATNGGDVESELTVDMDDEPAAIINNAYDKLCIVFEEKTGLTLEIKYHDKEDRYDEVNGMFWEVDGVYEKTAAGKKYDKDIERKFWTTFG
jgi:hypothetical protein